MIVYSNYNGVGAYPMVITAYQTGFPNNQVEIPFVLFINAAGNTCLQNPITFTPMITEYFLIGNPLKKLVY
jgi:hypothetical protein